MTRATDFHVMRRVAAAICDIVEAKDAAYGSSWKKRGGPGAYMVMARKWDRIENMASKKGWDIFRVLEEGEGDPKDDVADLIGYLLLIIEHVGAELPLPLEPDLTPSARPASPAQEFQGYPYPWEFNIRRMNKTFGVPAADKPAMYTEKERSINALGRLQEFKRILQEELNEVDDVIASVAAGVPPEDALTALADWLGDMQVYCASEMVRWGIPVEDTLRCIMDSQWSKLDTNGDPIVRDGKFVKGPHYVPPEATIKDMLIRRMEEPSRVPITLPQKVEIHEDNVWQCEGYYGDGTQLYRHKKQRHFFTRQPSLEAAYAWHATQPQA
jgi:hypothetical protein